LDDDLRHRVRNAREVQEVALGFVIGPHLLCFISRSHRILRRSSSSPEEEQ